MPQALQRNELAAWLRLALTPGIGNRTARRLLAGGILPMEVFDHPDRFSDVLNAAQARALHSEPPELAALLERTWQWLHAGTPHVAHALWTWTDSAYPSALLQTADPPLLLYAVGAASWLEQERPFLSTTCLAIVGSRHPSTQGARDARDFAQALVQQHAQLCIVSGLAQGIDAAAHEGALSGTPALERGAGRGAATLAVVGTGLDRVYPSHHRDLAHRIARQGMLLSEFHLGTPPRAENFPKRNRIISGLSQGVLVVEAALQSGSLITARMALEQGREVFAIPGSIHAPQSRGCHALIRQGAKLVETAQDIVEELRLEPPPQQQLSSSSSSSLLSSPIAPTLPAASLPDDPILAAMGWEAMGLDALQARTGLSTAALQVALLDLELCGQITRLPGGWFQRMARA